MRIRNDVRSAVLSPVEQLCLAAALLTLAASSACVTAPNNGQPLAAREAAVSFTGLAAAPRRLLWVEAAASATGPFASWSGAATRSRALPTDLVPFLGPLSAPVFAWSLETVVPSARWSTVTDADGCTMSETFVRVRDAFGPYRTFDAAGADTPSGVACFEAAVMGGATPLAAYETCGSSETPVMRLTAGASRHVGDVLIDDAADIEALRCVELIEGSLRVTSTAPALVALPKLKQVTGALELIYTSTALSTSSELQVRCGMSGPVTADVRRFELPLLAVVGGAVTLQQENSVSGPASTQAIDLGLDALTQIGGDLTIEIEQFGGSPCGLTALTMLPADFTLRILSFGEIGHDSNGLLPLVSEVAGTVSLIGGHNTFANPLATLTRAGALYIEHGASLSGFDLPSLTDVDGAVVIEGGGPTSHPVALLRAGSLRISDSAFSSLEQFGGASLTLGGLELVDNPSLQTLTSPLNTSKVALTNAAPLTVTGNPLLAASSLCSFVAIQQALGWSGSADLGPVVCP